MSTVLIIGAGSGVGHAAAKTFAAAGYKVALASRTAKIQNPAFTHFVFDASKPDTVSGLFESVRKAVGIPSVVIYNAYGSHLTTPETPFETSLDDFSHDMHVNATSGWISARESVQGFEDLDSEGKLGPDGGTFIFTGNMLNDTVCPGFLPFGMGKTAAAHLVKYLALLAYPGKPYKFYWGDERHADGTPMYTGVNGPAHAEHYLSMVKDPKQGPWQQTFVEGKGYVEFARHEFAIRGQ
ncbi:hypothetical protein PISL3812_08299 [Talaromyces islandicus]|uniref:Uncharacterized protein n=1 Tax=Talaromyces islandicus TaxID=28573 RepID=A0A0U1M864_TALIS|nr:hypothetical protein PISL3812_08299 [Talaromyces islandicus]